jgi:hypothetical protein
VSAVVKRVILLLIAGCASTSQRSANSEKHPLENIRLVQDFGPDVHLESIVATVTDPVPDKPCPAGRPIRVDAVLRREGAADAISLTYQMACVHDYTRPNVVIKEDQQTQVLRMGTGRPPNIRTKPAVPAADGGPPPGAPTTTTERLVSGPGPKLPAAFRTGGSEPTHYAATICIAIDGSVQSVLVVADRHHPELDARVFDALRRWRWEPATLNGHSVPSCPIIRIKL